MAAPPAPKATKDAITDEFSGLGWTQLKEAMRARGISRDPYDVQDDCRRKLRAHKAGNPAPPPPPAAPAEDATAPSPTSSVSYPVDALVEARWRGGSKYYPALVLASSASGTTVDLKYVDDSDEEDNVPVELVRPANRRLLQRYFELTGKRTPTPKRDSAAATAYAVVADICQGREMYCALERRAQVCCDRRVKWAYVCARRVRGRRPEDGAARGTRAAQHGRAARPS